MTNWEYLYVELEIDDNEKLHPKNANGQELQGWQRMTLHDYSNWLGQQGWELVTSTNEDFLIFKRPLSGF
jgi:hypothetical protein